MKFSDDRFNDLKKNYTSFIPQLATLHEFFGGPSIYFHQKALKACKEEFLSDYHIEMIYATLPAWGMHRMGETETKVIDYPYFKKSIRQIKSQLEELKSLKLNDLNRDGDNIRSLMEKLCFRLKVSVSNSKVVGNSKAIAHILPNIAPPIDREHTIRFFAKGTRSFAHKDEPYIYAQILSRCHEFISTLKEDRNIKLDNHFNTSYPKVFDNLVILYIKAMKDRQKAKNSNNKSFIKPI